MISIALGGMIKHRGAGDHADGEARIVVVAQHLRHGDAGKNRRRGDRRAGDRGEHRIGTDRRHADPALHPPENIVHDIIDIGAETGFGDDEPHEGEKRHRRKRIFGHTVADGDFQEVDRKLDIVAD